MSRALTFPLTTGVDNIPGTSGPDLVTGTINLVTAAENTYSPSDAINGGAGTDTLQITIGATGTTAGVTQSILPTQQAVETVRVINVDSAATNTTHTFNANSMSGLVTAEVSSSSKAVNFSNLANTSVKLSAVSNTAAVDFGIKTTALTGAADKISLSLSSNSGDVTVNSASAGAGIEAADLTVAGTNGLTATATPTVNKLIGTAADLKTLTIGGAGSIYIDTSTTASGIFPGNGDLRAVTSLDASANSGGIYYSAVAANATLMGGSGADTLLGGSGNDTIMGGAGNDSITAGAGNDSVDAGAGNDTVVVSSVTKSDTIVGGDGTDTLSLATALGYSTTSGTNDGSGISGFETLRATATLTQNMKA
ncbi:MAG: hypothetical protein EBV34_15375, partial [Betaproteobacteria bacterium]|nr:hypothetical protein [Betaproteobacteria bacterium]